MSGYDWFFSCPECRLLWPAAEDPYPDIHHHINDTEHSVTGPYRVPLNGCGEPMYVPPLSECPESPEDSC